MSLLKPDHTVLACLDRCEQELVWRHLANLKPNEEPASAHFGKMLHYGVKALYDGRTLTDAIVEMLRHWHDGPTLKARATAAALGAEGEDWRCPTCLYRIGSGKTIGAPTCPNCTGVAMVGMHPRPDLVMPMFLLVDVKKPWLGAHEAQRWLTLYEAAYIRVRSLFGSPSPDVPGPFKVIWNEGYAESATESGLPDRAVETSDGQVWAMDLKTTGMWLGATGQTSAMFRSYEHSMQAAMQIDLLEAELQRPVAGFWLDVINVKPKGLPTLDGLRRYGPLTYSKALRDELRGQRLRKAARIQRLQEHPEEAEKRLGACVRYNALCAYFDLCHADPAERTALVQIKLDRGELTEEAWEPKTRT